jgi:hypothetical protein
VSGNSNWSENISQLGLVHICSPTYSKSVPTPSNLQSNSPYYINYTLS